MRTRWSPLAIAAVGIVALAGCTQPTGPEPSPTPEPSASGDVATQCRVVLDEVSQLSTDIAMLATQFGTNPLAAAGLVPGIVERASGLGDQVRDPELTDRVDAIAGVATQAVDDAQAAIATGDVDAAREVVASAVAEVEPAIAELQAFCAEQ